jgi:16S rRNA m(2)G 1207 methyltransferase (EC 2.1.1.52)
LIETFREPDVDGPILDVGCGYGPIGLALAKSYPGRDIHLIDVNERALHLASENAEKNGIFNVKIYESDRLAQVEVRDFAAIVTNPPIRAGKQIVFRILEESYDHLRAGGELWVVVQKKQGAPSVKNRMEEIFRQVEMVERKKGYHILMAKKGDEEA